MNVEHEQNARVLSDFGANFILPILAPDGVWVAPGIAPLPAEIIKRELRRIAEHENYKPTQTIIFYSNDAKMLTLANGAVQIEDDPDHDTRPPA